MSSLRLDNVYQLLTLYTTISHCRSGFQKAYPFVDSLICGLQGVLCVLLLHIGTIYSKQVLAREHPRKGAAQAPAVLSLEVHFLQVIGVRVHHEIDDLWGSIGTG